MEDITYSHLMLKNVKCFISPIINITEHLMDWLFCRKLRMRLVYLICLGHGSDRPPRTDHRDLLSARVRSSPQFLRRPFVLPHRPPLVLPLLRFRSADSHILFYLWPNLFPLSCSGAQQKWRLFLSPAHTHTHTHTLVFFFAVHQSDRSRLVVLGGVKHRRG